MKSKKFKLSTRIDQIVATLNEAKAELAKSEASRNYAAAVGHLDVASEMTARVTDFIVGREADERRAGL